MFLSGHNVKSMVESNIYQGIEAKLNLIVGKKYDSTGDKCNQERWYKNTS